MPTAPDGKGARTACSERSISDRITVARVAAALDVDVGSEQMRVGLDRLAREAQALAFSDESLRPAAQALAPLVERVFQRPALELAQSESCVQISGPRPAVAALLDPPPPFLAPELQRTWRERRFQVYLKAVIRGEALPKAVAEGLSRLGKRSAQSIGAAAVLAGPAPAIAALASGAPGWIRPVARAFHAAAIHRPVPRARISGPVPPDAPRQRKYRPLASLKPLIVRALRLRRVGHVMQGSFIVPAPQWRAIADRLPSDLRSDQAAYASALYFACRFQIPPRNFDCIRLGPWRPDGESWLDLGIDAGHLSVGLADLTRTPSRWPPELAHRAVLFVPVAAVVLEVLRQRAAAGEFANLAELLIGPARWMGDFERYLHSFLAITAWPVTLERLLAAFPEYAASQLGNEVAVDAALAYGGLASLSSYHYSTVRADRLLHAARAIDQLLGL